MRRPLKNGAVEEIPWPTPMMPWSAPFADDSRPAEYRRRLLRCPCDRPRANGPDLRGGGRQRPPLHFEDLAALTNRIANVLTAAGLARGDRVGVFLPQAPETAIAPLAAFKPGWSRCRSSLCSATRRWSIGSPRPAPRRW